MTCHSGGTLEIISNRFFRPSSSSSWKDAGRARARGARLGAWRYVVVAEPNVTVVDFPTADRITSDLADVNVDERTSIVIAMRGDR